MSGPEGDGEQYLAVTNGSRERLRARFHGQMYEWVPGETVNISVDAARHIFDFGKEDKTTAFLRLGWINANQPSMDAALAKLDDWEFVPVLQVFTSDGAQPIPQRVSVTKGIKSRKGKIIASDSGSRPVGGEGSGEASASPAAPDDDEMLEAL